MSNSVLFNLIDDLKARGLVAQLSAEQQLMNHLAGTSRTLYAGFDPTADSLHIGSLIPLLSLRRFQLTGHRPVILVGGGTGLIGDPSFKAQERSLNSNELVAQWVARLKQQVSIFVDFDRGSSSAQLANNADWLADLNVLAFLRDVGKHFSVNNMIQKESVKQRINRQEVGISFTEFSYMILQAYDFSVLHKRYGCTLQIGGSDQWGNITAGIDLTRRLWQSTVYGLTLPLITKSDGSKFGKTEAGTIWLSADKTSPYAFYQFWLNVADADVYRFLAYFTFLTLSEINQIEQQDKARASKPQAQAILAQEVTRLVHGEAGLAAAQRITQALFNDDLNQLTVEDFAQLKLDGLATTELPLTKVALVEALVKTGLASSNRAAREFTSNGAVKVNGNKQLAVDTELNAAQGFFGSYFVIKRGKKLFHLLCLKS